MAPTLRTRLERALASTVLRLPRPWLVRVSGNTRRRVEGWVLDEQVQAALAMHSMIGKKATHELSVADARRELESSTQLLAPPRRSMDRVEERRAPGPGGDIPVRVYVPMGIARPAPALVFFHGGGFVLGSLDSHDAPCRELAHGAGCVVIAVDYRLAPEHPFPAAVEDALAAFRWVASQADALGVDPARIAVGGDSAGGNLAAVVSQLARDEGGARPSFQLLVYPSTDMTMSMPSHRQMGEGFLLEGKTVEYFRHHYLGDAADRLDPRASPLFAEELGGLPPALVLTAGFDPLRDEGKAYADRLAEAGVAVDYRCYGGLFHGFFSATGGIAAAAPALEHAASSLRDAFATSPANGRERGVEPPVPTADPRAGAPPADAGRGGDRIG